MTTCRLTTSQTYYNIINAILNRKLGNRVKRISFIALLCRWCLGDNAIQQYNLHERGMRYHCVLFHLSAAAAAAASVALHLCVSVFIFVPVMLVTPI